MAELWEDDMIQKFIVKMKETEEDVKVPRFAAISKSLKEHEVEVPGDYEDGMDLAIEVLANIQKYRDIVIQLKIALVDKRNILNKLWHTARATFMMRDATINGIETVAKKEAAIKLVFLALYDKMTLANDNVECMVDLVENAVAKFNTVSRQVSLMEMQIRLGEVESKRRRFSKE